MSEKSINYMSRDYNTIKNDLISLSNQYYPELADTFNDGSVGSWIIDLVSSVGDELNYYIDRCYSEQNINSAALKSSVLNFARMNNVKIPGPKAATCEVEISVTLPGTGGYNGSMAMPNWEYAPKLARGATISNGSAIFEITEDVDFKEQFNSDAISNRRWRPVRNSQGSVTGYTVSKTVIATAGRSITYKKVLTANDIEPFMEIILPFRNVMAVEGVLFKETSDRSITPEQYEFYVNAEKFRVLGESITTYRFFEVNSLTDQYIFGEEVDTPGAIEVFKDPHAYLEYDTNYKDISGTTANPPFVRYYKGSWMPLMQKFITEYTDNGYIKLIFGSGTNRTDLTDVGDGSDYAQYQLSKIVNNDLTGILPKAGWTMYVLYRDGGGTITNLSPGSLTQLGNAKWTFDTPSIDPSNQQEYATWRKNKSAILASVNVTNTTQCLAGVDAPSAEEVKFLTKYSNSAQNRCVTLKDYELRMKMMPAKYGGAYRCRALEENNKILLYTLGLTSDGKLTEELVDVVTENMINYMSKFKSLGDFIEIRSGNIYNIQTELSVYIDKTYNTQAVVRNIMETVEAFFNVDGRNMGDDIFIGDLEKSISQLDGVANLISVKIYTIWGTYGNRKLGRQALTPTIDIGEEYRKEINLTATNKILSCDAQGMYEIKDKASDIKVKVSLI